MSSLLSWPCTNGRIVIGSGGGVENSGVIGSDAKRCCEQMALSEAAASSGVITKVAAALKALWSRRNQ